MATTDTTTNTGGIVPQLTNVDIAPITTTTQSLPVVTADLATNKITDAKNTADNLSVNATNQAINNQTIKQGQIDTMSKQVADMQKQASTIQAKWDVDKKAAEEKKLMKDATDAAGGLNPYGYDKNGNPIANPNATTTVATAETDPSKAWADYQSNGGQLSQVDWDNGGKPKNDITNADGTPMTEAQIIQNNQRIAIAKSQKLIEEGNNIMNKYLAGAFPLTESQLAQVNALAGVWDQTIMSQEDANDTYVNMAMMQSARAGGEYSTTSALASATRAIRTGLGEVSSLQQQKASALAKLKQSFQDQAYKAALDNHNSIIQIEQQISDSIEKTTMNLHTINQDAKTAADKIKTDAYNQVTKPIQEIVGKLREAGAPDSVITAATAAKTVEEAYTAAGKYLTNYSHQMIGDAESGYYNVVFDPQGNQISKTLVKGGTGTADAKAQVAANKETPYDTQLNDELRKNPDPLAAANKIIDAGNYTATEASVIRTRAMVLSKLVPVDFSGAKVNGLTMTLSSGQVLTFPNKESLEAAIEENNIGTTSQEVTPSNKQSKLQNRISELQEQNKKMGFPRNTGLREQLVLQEGYPVKSVDEILSPISTGLTDMTNQFLKLING